MLNQGPFVRLAVRTKRAYWDCYWCLLAIIASDLCCLVCNESKQTTFFFVCCFFYFLKIYFMPDFVQYVWCSCVTRVGVLVFVLTNDWPILVGTSNNIACEHSVSLGCGCARLES